MILYWIAEYNDITQRGNIWTNGYGAVGVRIDGLSNKIIVPQGTEIHSDGKYGAGVLVAYGKNHNVVLDGTVTANGDGGNAVSFDFGANTLGGTIRIRRISSSRCRSKPNLPRAGS